MIDVSILDRHERIAMMFSGGKDSMACLYLLREQLHRITLIHIDTGDLLPETREIVAHIKKNVPNFIHVQGDVHAWIGANGLPTDLLPWWAHPIGALSEPGPKLVPRLDCCWNNLMAPAYLAARERGFTLVIRGTKTADLPRLPLYSGAVVDGVEYWHPIEDWTHEQVFSYLRLQGAPVSRVYDYVDNSPECAQCSAWWGEKRGAYLRKYHPELWRGYGERLRVVTEAIDQPIANLQEELKAFAKESV